MSRQKKQSDQDLSTQRSSPPTIDEVARLAEVSIATVSRVLNGQAGVSPKTRERVLQSVQTMGYESGRLGLKRALDDHPRLIGLTSVAMSQDENTEIIDGIVETLHMRNMRPVICPLPNRHNCGMPLLERLMGGVTDGGLIVGSVDSDEEVLDLYQGHFPVVLINPDRPLREGFPVVATAYEQGARSAVEHLLALGHKRIGMISTQNSPHTYRNKLLLDGLQFALFSAHQTVFPELLALVDTSYQQAGYEGAQRLFQLPEPPTALITLNDEMATGVLEFAHDHGISVPEDLSLIGSGDTAYSKMVRPHLSTIHYPFPEMGRVGVDMLLRIRKGQPLEATRIELAPRLIIRASTAAARTL